MTTTTVTTVTTTTSTEAAAVPTVTTVTTTTSTAVPVAAVPRATLQERLSEQLRGHRQWRKASKNRYNGVYALMRDSGLTILRRKNRRGTIYAKYDPEEDKLYKCTFDGSQILGDNNRRIFFTSPNKFGKHEKRYGVDVLKKVDVLKEGRTGSAEDDWTKLGRHLERHFRQPDNENS